MKFFDISLPVKSGMVVYPGNPPTEIVPFQKMPRDSSNSSLITMGSHAGTHIDAPLHVDTEGASVDEVDLEALVGKCRVLDMTHVSEGITVEDLEKSNIIEEERILVRTQNSIKGFNKWRDNYIYLSGDGADYLAKKRIRLFGIDALSVKKRGEKDKRAHTSLLEKGIVIFEGLDLSAIKPGEYIFVGLPLRLIGIDGAPARAVLVKGALKR